MRNTLSSNANILGGIVVFTGTRVPVKNLMDYLKQGKTIDDFIIDFPSVNKKQVETFLEQVLEEVLDYITKRTT